MRRRLSVLTKIIRFARAYKTMFHSLTCIFVAPFVLYCLFGFSLLLSILFGLCLYGVTGGWKWYKLIWKTLPRDLIALSHVVRTEIMVKKMIRNKTIIADILEKNARLYPQNIAFKDAETGVSLTYREANDLANQIGNFFYNAGYRRGDAVALMMENRIEYVPLWMGLSKIGVITALINTNLKGDSLKHCVKVSECKSLIYSETFESVVNAEEKQFSSKIDLYFFGETKNSHNVFNLKDALIKEATMAPPRTKDISVVDKMLYIYTSGTTGLPKAAIIRGSRFLYMGFTSSTMAGINKHDVCYLILPLYHVSGGVVLTGGALFHGATLLIRKRFSASKFFQDCVIHECTVFNYIGEMCRYLLAQPKTKFDTSHKIKVCVGNGLRQSLWKEFQQRFAIPLICEFYGSTEGNVSMFNNTGQVGAVGYNSVLLPWVVPMKLVVLDEETGELIRGTDGLPIAAKVGEPGEIVGKIRSDAIKQFDGYLNTIATKKKIAHDVFSKGDSAFLSGDILVQDEEGFYYFQDRTGDTFRWKGENVSTNEVEGVISKSVKLNDVCVYGVEVEGIEGKAGMACIVDPDRQVDLESLYSKICSTLPAYARPVFVRLSNVIEKTGTHKFQKTALRKQGFDPAKCTEDDLLFYFDGNVKKYLPITPDVYSDVVNQKIRF